MSTHRATISWKRGNREEFARGRYSRVHQIAFERGETVEASGAPANVPHQFSSPTACDPEELFVAAISSCHMLWFLDLARRAGLDIEAYEDAAEGTMGKDDGGRAFVAAVTLRPRIVTPAPREALDAIHARAHEACFIANSVKTTISVEPR